MKIVVREGISCLDPAVESGMAAARAVTKVAVCAAGAHAADRGKR